MDLAFVKCVEEQLYRIQRRHQGHMDRELSPESELDDRESSICRWHSAWRRGTAIRYPKEMSRADGSGAIPRV